MMAIRHFFLLFFEFAAYAFVNGKVWPLMLFAFLFFLGALIFVGQAAAPFAIYAIF